MIIFEIFTEIILEGIIYKLFRFIGKGFNKLGELFTGTKKKVEPIKMLEKKFLYKKIELTKNLNEKLKSGQKGAVLEIINENKIFAEFYNKKGKQIELNNELVFEIGMNQFKLKNKNCTQHRVKKIAGKSLLTKILADFLSVIYLLTLVLKPRNFPYTNTLCFINQNVRIEHYQ
jgi:hypothetical protein